MSECVEINVIKQKKLSKCCALPLQVPYIKQETTQYKYRFGEKFPLIQQSGGIFDGPIHLAQLAHII